MLCILSRHATVLPAALLLACGEDPPGPGPWADVAGEYQLHTVNAAALPYNMGGNEWLFERRMVLSDRGAVDLFDVYCLQSGAECPRRTRVSRTSLDQRGPGDTFFFDYGSAYRAVATLDANGRLELAITNLAAGGGPANTVTYRYQRE